MKLRRDCRDASAAKFSVHLGIAPLKEWPASVQLLIRSNGQTTIILFPWCIAEFNFYVDIIIPNKITMQWRKMVGVLFTFGRFIVRFIFRSEKFRVAAIKSKSQQWNAAWSRRAREEKKRALARAQATAILTLVIYIRGWFNCIGE